MGKFRANMIWPYLFTSTRTNEKRRNWKKNPSGHTFRPQEMGRDYYGILGVDKKASQESKLPQSGFNCCLEAMSQWNSWEDMGVSIVMGVPENGWFIRENPTKMVVPLGMMIKKNVWNRLWRHLNKWSIVKPNRTLLGRHTYATCSVHCSFYPPGFDSSWLVVWNIFYFPRNIGLLIIPIDFHIFQRGGPTTNQVAIEVY